MLLRRLAVLALLPCSTLAALAAPEQWPSFRGPRATGVAENASLPARWDITSGVNVRWVREIPGYSHSSPIVWDDAVFLLTAVSADPSADGRREGVGNVAIDDLARRQWNVLRLSRTDGSLVWERTAHAGVPRVRRHEKGTYANSTPATDGRHLVAIFASEGLYCYDLDGHLLWQKDLGRLDPGYWGRPDRPWGHGSSPILFEDLVIVQADKFEDSFLAAYRLADGEEVWRLGRDELATWSTPTLHFGAERTQLITQGGNSARGYDPRSGRELWRFTDHAEVKVPTPFVADDVIILAGGAPRGRPIYGLDVGVSGDVSSEPDALRFTINSGGPYTSTPLAYGSYLYVTRDAGIIAIYDLADGRLLNRKRLGSGFSASGVAADGKVFLTSEDGQVFVLRPGPELEVVATNDMDEPCYATPAISGDLLLVRTRSQLYAIGQKSEPDRSNVARTSFSTRR